MTVFVKLLARFQTDESAAVTTDWVVLTSAIVGIAMVGTFLISSGIEGASGGIVSGVGASSDSAFNTQSTQVAEEITDNAKPFYDIGIAAKPNSRYRAWRVARAAAIDSSAPDGYWYGANSSNYVDTTSGNLMYFSDDRKSYSIGGEVVLKSDYDKSNRASFKTTFYAYWDSQNG